MTDRQGIALVIFTIVGYLLIMRVAARIALGRRASRHRTCRPWGHRWEVVTGGASGFLSRCTRCRLEKVREW